MRTRHSQQNNLINRGYTPQRAQWSFWKDVAVVILNKQDLNLCLSRARLETYFTFLLECVSRNQPNEFHPHGDEAASHAHRLPNIVPRPLL